MPYLIDTDVLIDLTRNNQAAISYLDSLPEAWSVSVITALEIIVGARDQNEVAKVDQLLASVPSVPLTPGGG